MKTLIQAVEVWVPDADGYLLEFGGGLYGDAVAFGAVSRAMCFGRAEGLPGRVWDEGHPILLKELQGGYFQRAAAAQAAGLTCAVAFPVYAGDALKAVVVFYCGADTPHIGAIELWRNDPRVTTDMTLVDGYYGAQAQGFAAASHDTSLPRGAGLPGLSWQREAAVFMNGLPGAAKFLRSAEAAAAGMQRGLALPCAVPGQVNYVLDFLSTTQTPIALRLESWVPGATAQSMQRSFGFCETAGMLPVGDASAAQVADHEGIAEAFATSMPQVRQMQQKAPNEPAGSVATGLDGMIALPLARDGVVAEVLALYF